MKKFTLFTPGPAEVPPRVLKVMSEPIIHHRSQDFREIFFEVREKLKKLFKTKQDVIVFASSGTGAMEAAVVNFFSKGDKALVINGGKFGERWSNICKAYGLEVEEIVVPWGEAVDPEDVRKALEKDGKIKGVFIQACETSTGVEHPVRDVAKVVREKKGDDALFVVDGITGVAVFDINMDGWDIDILLTGSQKALMLPPGLAMISASERAMKFMEKSDLPKFYFSIKKEMKSQKEGETAWTPAISLIKGLRESLRMIIDEEGLENVFERHKRLASILRGMVEGLGLRIYAKRPAAGLTTIEIDNAEEKRKKMRELGAWVAGGQDKLKGKIIRIAHMGYYTEGDMIYVGNVLKYVVQNSGK
ncbi:MAG: alanine--glyoxylate aminotransferase family protein [Candidatus Calescibacterium sp.]|nr:alanine--glyoxylate aminotransferase family protein [Candidatus Calescibacterium sp.]MCX7734587.1 alanine--glyoxylate aminotransferase family protein [bacterium]MDW8086513.1 alanine--glyoxylate aminotransferase family protein [Candidatus Calescibacterium sp.]